MIGRHRVYSEAPIGTSIATVVAAADDKVAYSPIRDARASDQSLFLTKGGWRWNWLSMGQRDAFALSRPLVETVVVNASDAARDRVVNCKLIGGVRTFSDTLAHEMTHG